MERADLIGIDKYGNCIYADIVIACASIKRLDFFMDAKIRQWNMLCARTTLTAQRVTLFLSCQILYGNKHHPHSYTRTTLTATPRWSRITRMYAVSLSKKKLLIALQCLNIF